MNRWRRVLSIGLSIGLCVGVGLYVGLFGFSGRAIAQSVPAPISALETIAPITGASLFEANCAACHAGGGNIIRRGKNLKRNAMERHGFGDVGAIASIVTKGKGIMPAYADRLNGEEIEAIAQYVHQQSEAGW